MLTIFLVENSMLTLHPLKKKNKEKNVKGFFFPVTENVETSIAPHKQFDPLGNKTFQNFCCSCPGFTTNPGEAFIERSKKQVL